MCQNTKEVRIHIKDGLGLVFPAFYQKRYQLERVSKGPQKWRELFVSCLQIRISTNVFSELCLGEIRFWPLDFMRGLFFSSENSDLALIKIKMGSREENQVLGKINNFDFQFKIDASHRLNPIKMLLFQSFFFSVWAYTKIHFPARPNPDPQWLKSLRRFLSGVICRASLVLLIQT